MSIPSMVRFRVARAPLAVCLLILACFIAAPSAMAQSAGAGPPQNDFQPAHGAVDGPVVSAGPLPPVLVSAKLRRVHGAVTYDMPVSLSTTTPTAEPRQGPNTTIVFTFDKPITAAVASSLEGDVGIGPVTITGNDVAVSITGITEMQYFAVGLANVDALDGGTGGSGVVRVGQLTGDVNRNGVVSIADLGLINAQLTLPVTAANYLMDVNANGTITIADKGIANSKLTRALPAPVCPTPTGAGTTHSTLIPGDHWTVAGNPHIVTFDVGLNSGTLTLDPCVVVRVQEGYNIRIGNATGASASLIALGSPYAPIVFESQDPTKFWGSLRIFPTGQADLEGVQLNRAGNPATALNLGGALQVLGNGVGTPLVRSARVRNVRIDTAATSGLNLQQGGGLTADSTGLVIVNSAGTPGVIGMSGNYPVLVFTPAVNTLPPGQYTGNSRDEILVVSPSTIAVDETFHNRGVPYRMLTGFSMSPTLPASLGGPTTLTIEAGVTIRLLKDVGNDWAFALGASNGDLPANIWPVRLIANGTLSQPITFTSAAAVPAAGDWAGILWRGGPATGNIVNNVHVEYAGGNSGTAGFGCGPGDNDAALLINNWIPGEDFIHNSTFSNSLASGIVMGWISDTTRDFRTGNTFTAIGNSCAVARWKNKTLPACPGPPPVCL